MSAGLADLPFLIQCRILSHLSLSQLLLNVSPINRYFYGLTRKPVFWVRLDFSRSACHLSLGYLRQILGWAPLVETLILCRQSDCPAEFSPDASAIVADALSLCPRLAYLRLAYLNPDPECVARMCASPSRRLRHLDLSGCEGLTPELVALLAEAFPCLESLCLAHCRRSCGEGVGDLGRRLTRLSYINLDENTAPAEGIAALVASRRDTLERLVLDASGCSTRHLAALTECERLRLLHCDFAEDLTDDLLDSVLPCLASRLQSLTIRKAQRLSVGAFEWLACHVAFPCLVHLDLSECRQLTDSGLAPLLASSGFRLEQLVLNWCWQVTDKSVESIVENCSRLRSLSLVGLHELTGRQLATRAPQCLPGLRFLDLRSCNAIDDAACRRLVADLPDLCIVDFYGFVVGAADSGDEESSTAGSPVGFAATENWIRPVDLLRM